MIKNDRKGGPGVKSAAAAVFSGELHRRAADDPAGAAAGRRYLRFSVRDRECGVTDTAGAYLRFSVRDSECGVTDTASLYSGGGRWQERGQGPTTASIPELWNRSQPAADVSAAAALFKTPHQQHSHFRTKRRD